MQSSSEYQYLDSLGNLELLAKQVVEGFITGLHKSPFHGFSVEFAEHRSYNTGDSLKNIDWKLFAKTEKLYTKRYEEETNLRCQFVLDCSSSMYFPDQVHNKLKFSTHATAALIYLLRRQRDAFGLSFFSNHLTLNTPARSTIAHQKHLFMHLSERLRQGESNNTTDLAKSLHQIAELVHQRSMIVIFSDLMNSLNSEDKMSALFSALQHLKFNKHEVIIFNVADKAKEIDFNFENRPYEFVDMETGVILKTHTAEVKSAYITEMNAYRKLIQLKCAQYKIDLVDADINTGFSPILQAYLIKRQKMA